MKKMTKHAFCAKRHFIETPRPLAYRSTWTRRTIMMDKKWTKTALLVNRKWKRVWNISRKLGDVCHDNWHLCLPYIWSPFIFTTVFGEQTIKTIFQCCFQPVHTIDKHQRKNNKAEIELLVVDYRRVFRELKQRRRRRRWKRHYKM